jgi:hypothetical protein
MIGVTSVKITRNQKSDAELPSKLSINKTSAADFANHVSDKSTKKQSDANNFKVKGERCIVEDRSSARRLESPPALDKKKLRETRKKSIRPNKKKSSIEY